MICGFARMLATPDDREGPSTPVSFESGCKVEPVFASTTK
jgi:hypothetical protein